LERFQEGDLWEDSECEQQKKGEKEMRKEKRRWEEKMEY